MARRCLFCTNRPTSKEHAWPQWVLDWVGENKPAILHAWLGPNAEEKTWGNSDITVKYLCKPCNNGWMSRLETRSRPVLRPLMTDFQMRLDGSQQLTIAHWTAKTAMVFEATNPTKDWYYQQGERDDIASSRSLPSGTVVWVGRYANSGTLFTQARRMRNPTTHGDVILSEGYVTTFCLGRLVLQILSLRWLDGHKRVRVTLPTTPGFLRDSLIRVFPSTGQPIGWPPSASFSDAGTSLENLADRFAPEP